jgi:hypothetical protein
MNATVVVTKREAKLDGERVLDEDARGSCLWTGLFKDGDASGQVEVSGSHLGFSKTMEKVNQSGKARSARPFTCDVHQHG